MKWPDGHPLKDARRCPWCGAPPSPDSTAFECEHEPPLLAIERTLKPDGYPDPEAALLWFRERQIKFDAIAFWHVSTGISHWNSEAVLRRHQKRLRIGAAVFWVSFVLVLVAEAWHLLR